MKFVCNTFGQIFKKSYLYILPYGYNNYVLIRLPSDKDPAKFDAKIRAKYGVAESAWIRHKRRKANQTDVRYLRFKRTVILWIFPGDRNHLVFQRETQIRDIRVNRIEVFGYSLGLTKQGKPELRMGKQRFEKARRKLLRISYHEQEKVQRTFNRIAPLYKYKGVIKQLEQIREEVNYSRAKVGLKPIRPRWEFGANQKSVQRGQETTPHDTVRLASGH